jgi:hypothetical protein
MSPSVRFALAAMVALAVMACSPLQPPKEQHTKVAVVSASGGKKVNYTYALNGTHKFAYTVEFVDPDPTSEWSPAMWFILEHKDASPAYQFMLFQGSDGSIHPEIRLLDQTEGRERKSIEPDFQVPVTSKILVEIEIEGNKVISSVNGQVVDTTELKFPIDQLRLGFSSGTFSIAGGLPGVPEVGS